MTARDDAIAAMASAFTAKVKQHPIPRHDPFGGTIGHFFGCSTQDAMAAALDAIPADVLTRLAAERTGPDVTIVHPHTHHEGTREA